MTHDNHMWQVYAHQIVEMLDLREVFQFYGFEIHNGYCCCPFHQEKTGSCRVWKDHFYCFGCGAGGDVISFVRQREEMSFQDALIRLNYDFSLNLPLQKRMTQRQARDYKRRCKSLMEARRRERERVQQRNEDYYALLSEYIRLDKAMRSMQPTGPDDELQEKFVEACHRLDYVGYLLDTFDWNAEEGGAAP